MNIPSGFTPHERRSPATDAWQPICSSRRDGCVVLGVLTGTAHTNSRGFVHGGVIAALADNAMGYSCAARAGRDFRSVTANLAIDYLAPARVGDWVEFRTHFVEVGRTLAIAECRVETTDRCLARANATFRRVRGEGG